VFEVCEDSRVQARALFAAYESWSFDEGIKYPISEQIFSRRMEERGFVKKRTSEANYYLDLKIQHGFQRQF